MLQLQLMESFVFPSSATVSSFQQPWDDERAVIAGTIIDVGEKTNGQGTGAVAEGTKGAAW